MRLDWSDLLAALAIVFIIEGVMPFIHPQFMKRMFARLAAADSRELRIGGLLSMALGLAILFWARS